MDTIYERPRDYDLEHEGDEEDVRFYLEMVRRLRPKRVLELAAGSGRVTVPLAGLAADLGCDIVGLELAAGLRPRRPAQLGGRRAVRSDCHAVLVAHAPAHARRSDRGVAARLRQPQTRRPLCRRSGDAEPGGLCRFDADATADAGRDRRRHLRSGHRRAAAALQDDAIHSARTARRIRFLYDKLAKNVAVDRYVSDFESHVYYPREVELLFRLTGFEVETRYGDYRMRPLRSTSRAMIFTAVRR